jgi:hypothetical protein
MKEAKSEAEQIISAYRAEMEAQYQKSLATVSSMFLQSALLYLSVSQCVFLCNVCSKLAQVVLRVMSFR